MQSFKWTKNDITLHYQTNQNLDKNTILFIHGNGMDLTAFDALLPHFTNTHRLFNIDLQGHGQSSWSNRPYSVKKHMQDVLGFIEDNIDTPPIIIGHSIGAMIGLMLAHEHPNQVQALVLGDAPLSYVSLMAYIRPQQESFGTIAKHIAQKNLAELESLFGNVYQAKMALACDPNVVRIVCDDLETMMEGYDPLAYAPALQLPILLQHGHESKGSVVMADDLNAFQSALTCQHITDLMPAGHNIYIEAPDETFISIQNFFKQCMMPHS